MKITVATCLSSFALALSLFAQTPTLTPDVSAQASATVAPAVPPPAAAAPTAPTAPAVVATATPRAEDDLESRIERKAKRGVNITIGGHDRKSRRDREDNDDDRIQVHGSDFDDGALMAIPIVGIIFSTLFGAPVLIVGVIMFFSYIKARSLHKTVRMMVEKGQPVPEALFATPHTPAKQRSDMRRGVILVMIGLGIMLFLAAVNEFEGGAWALGLIPFMIGAGYILVWQLDNNKSLSFNRSTDNPPPLP